MTESTVRSGRLTAARTVSRMRWVVVIVAMLQAVLITKPTPIGGWAPMFVSAAVLGLVNLLSLRISSLTSVQLERLLRLGICADFVACAFWSLLVTNDLHSVGYMIFIIVGLEAAFLFGWRGALVVTVGFGAELVAIYALRWFGYGYSVTIASVLYRFALIGITTMFSGAMAGQSEERRLEAESAGREARERADELRVRTAERDALLRAISEMGVGVVQMLNERIVYANEAFQNLTGYTEDDLKSLESFDKLMTAETRNALRGRPWGTKTPSGEGELFTVGGDTVPVDWTARLRVDGGTAHTIAVVRDARERRRYLQTIEAARDEAQKATRAKSEYLSRISHELRTPLTAILGFAELLAIENPRDDQLSAIEAVSHSGAHLRALIDDVLDISRIESGKTSVEMHAVALEPIVRESVALLSQAAGDHDVTVTVDAGEALPRVRGDAKGIKQICINLISNAIKFSPRGGEVRVRVGVGEGDDGQVKIMVSDRGAGIPADRLGSIFEPFERLGAARLGIQGAGLGLALVKELVGAMKASVDVASDVGSGTTFTVGFVVDAPSGTEATGRAGKRRGARVSGGEAEA